jgi:hypothetical protein
MIADILKIVYRLFPALKVPTAYGLHAEAVQAQFFCASLDALYDYQLTNIESG